MTHREFIRKYPEYRDMPEFIIGVGDKEVRFMDATYADLQRYQAFLKRRIQRRRALVRGKS